MKLFHFKNYDSKIPYILSFCLVLLLFFVSRFYNLDERIIFDWDQERDAWQIYELIRNYQPTLIGPRVVGEGGFFLPPYFTYLVAPFYFITNLDPSALQLFVGTYNIAFFSLALFIVSRIFGLNTALFFLFFWSANFLLVRYDITPWNPLLIPICIVSTWFLLHKIYHAKAKYYALLFALGAFVTFSFSMHFQYFFIALHAFVFLILIRNEIAGNKVMSTAVFGAALLLPLLPLFVFDIRNDFINTKLFIDFFFTGRQYQAGISHFTWLSVFALFLKPLTFIHSIPISIFIYLSATAMSIYLGIKSNGFNKIFFFSSLVVWISFPIFFTIYRNRPSEYYFIFMYPYLLITFISFFIHRKFYTALICIALIFLFINIAPIHTDMKSTYLNLTSKKKAIEKIKEINGAGAISLSYEVPLGRQVGFDYLLKISGLNYTTVDSGGNVIIRIPPKKNDIDVDGIGISIKK